VLHSRYGAARAGSSGIGLSLVAALVGRLGGTVVAGPAAEGGAAFRVDLPAAPHAGP
jgi:signal transduction histidine kinase